MYYERMFGSKIDTRLESPAVHSPQLTSDGKMSFFKWEPQKFTSECPPVSEMEVLVGLDLVAMPSGFQS